jgi:ATP-dependent DNA ligase
VKRLAAETPAIYVVFDLLAVDDGQALLSMPLRERRARLEQFCYDHVTGNRFRHGTKLLRWRPDKSPVQGTMDQVAQKKSDLLQLLK